MFEFDNQLTKMQFLTFVLSSLSSFFTFIAVCTPSWQVADDLDAHRSIQSGLWIYCPGASQCWYIFSDTLINYYERVDVCRFLLIGWHYAVLILILIALFLSSLAIGALIVGYLRPKYCQITTIVLDAGLVLSFLLSCIGLSVFMINAEMLESKYLIGVKNTFEKTYGYSFYLACFGLTIMLFALMGATLITTWVFFFNVGSDQSTYPTNNNVNKSFDDDRTKNYALQTSYNNQKYRMMQEAPSQCAAPFENVPKYCYSPSEMSIPTRTFLSY